MWRVNLTFDQKNASYISSLSSLGTFSMWQILFLVKTKRCTFFITRKIISASKVNSDRENRCHTLNIHSIIVMQHFSKLQIVCLTGISQKIHCLHVIMNSKAFKVQKDVNLKKSEKKLSEEQKRVSSHRLPTNVFQSHFFC